MKLLILLILISANCNANELRVGFIGLTYHSILPIDEAVPDINRKIDKLARMVWHPEININYIYDNKNSLVNITYLKDCLDNDAWHLGVGKRWKLDKDFYSGATIGIYRRQLTRHDLVTGLSNNGFDYIPMPQIFFERQWKINNEIDFSIQASSSIYLTHLTFGFNIGE